MKEIKTINQKIIRRKWMVNCILFCVPQCIFSGSPDTTQAGIPLNAPWKKAVYTFAQEHFQHSAWGVSHYERVYLLSLQIAKSEAIVLDPDVLFAAVLLHDMGAFKPYRKEGTDHAQRSVQVVEDVLQESGFPMEKLEAVKDAIRGHSYYDEPSDRPESILLHDADTLDFLGAMGILRIVSITGRGSWASDLPTALKTLKGFQKELPGKLITRTAQAIGARRIREMEDVFNMLEEASFGGRVL